MKKPFARIVKVPKTPRSAYNPARPISGLIENQLKFLAVVEQRLPPAHRTGVDISTLKTEGQASAYIHRLTALLHPEGADKPSAVEQARQPAAVRKPRVTATRKAPKRKKRRRLPRIRR